MGKRQTSLWRLIIRREDSSAISKQVKRSATKIIVVKERESNCADSLVVHVESALCYWSGAHSCPAYHLAPSVAHLKLAFKLP
jgi:hypothetical protein